MLSYKSNALSNSFKTQGLTRKHGGKHFYRTNGFLCKAGIDTGKEFLQNFQHISGGARGINKDELNSLEVAGQTTPKAVPTSGCGCKGSSSGAEGCAEHGQQDASAQDIISSFSSMVGGPDGQLSREDFQQAFNTPQGEGGPGDSPSTSERFWDIREILDGAPSDLVFFEDDGMVV